MIHYGKKQLLIGIHAGRGTSFSPTAVHKSLFFILKQLVPSSLSPAVLFLGSLIVFSPLIDGGTTHLPVLIMQLALLGALILWSFHRMKAGVIVFPRSRMLPILLVFLGWAGLSLVWAPYKNPSVQWFISLLMYALLFLAVIQGIRVSQQVWQMSVIVVGMGLCEGILGIIQYAFLGEIRARGTFYNPNFFATYMVAVLSIVLGLLSSTQINETRRWQRILLWSATGIFVCAFVTAQSRGAILALVAALAFIGCLRFGKVALIVIILSLIAGAVIPNPLRQRIVDVAALDPYAYSRVDIWKSSIERVIDRPLGVGAGLYKYTSFQYRFPVESNIVRYGKRAESAHNEYLQMAVELGIWGLALFLLGIGIWIREMNGVWRNSSKGSEWGLVLGLSGAVLAILAHAVVDSVFHEPALVTLMVLSGGLVIGARAIKIPEKSWWTWRCPFHPMRLAIVCVLVATLAVLSIQFAAGWYAHERGQAEAKADRQTAALDWFHKASLVDPGTTGYHDAVARTAVQLFHQSGDPQWLVKAVEEEAQAVELNPLDGRFPYRLGTIYGLLAEQKVSTQQRDLLLNQAAQAHEQAIRSDPYSPLSYLALAKIRLSQGRIDEVTSWLQQTVAIEPRFLPARALLAELSFKARGPEAAHSEFEAIVAIKRQYEGRVLTDLDRKFLDVDLYPLGRLLALEPMR